MTGFVVWLQEFGKVRVSVGSFKKKKKILKGFYTFKVWERRPKILQSVC